MRSSSVLLWLYAACRHATPGSGHEGSEQVHLGRVSDSFPLADGIAADDGLEDPEEMRVRYGTNLKSDNGLWEVRPSPGKGLGVFALRTIPKHTVIIDESPLFTIDPGTIVSGHGFAFDAIASAVDASFARLNATAKAAYLSCPEHREMEDAGFSREALIFRTNGYTMADGRIGIFPRIAKVNHSCRPNAAGVSVSGGRRVVWAGRAIAPGEEITATYAPLTQDTAGRRARLAQWGFECECEVCRAGSDDRQRVEMGRLTALLERELGRDAFGGDVLPDAEELVRLVEEDGLADYLAKAYKYAAYAASRSGRFVAARKWAKKELKVHEIADAESKYAKETKAFLESLPLI
ncbi:N-lysine methyltransferase SMYD2 [Colletotrichum trifolii]|uniref:N-lysine methyltransferase SMYD2 n=1 Tax=Colletotrichum trifolii TaxID=5466 RepID=A0A4R8QYG9_COLTR|nr:N-lysine methyltransferase SMYD2 [Colletotrichum trifolii]